MESPSKKRKQIVDMSRPQAASTPKPSKPTERGLYLSTINNTMSDLDLDQSKEDSIHNKSTSTSALDEVMDSVSEMDVDTEDITETDYDKFLETCKITRTGVVWKLYKPIDETTLYYKIFDQPKNTEELVYSYIQFSLRETPTALYLLVKFLFDCAGFRNLNVKQIFSYPLDNEKLLKPATKRRVVDENFKSTKFLFKDNSKMVRVYKYAIFNFTRKLIIVGNQQGFLEKSPVPMFLQLLIHCAQQTNVAIPLIYTAYIFIAKILTAICHIKSREKPANEAYFDELLSRLYPCFAKFSQITDPAFDTLKIECVNEIAIWITYFPNIFINHFDCIHILQSQLLEPCDKVRLATLVVFQKSLNSNDVVKSSLQENAINKMFSSVDKRTRDCNVKIRMKALDLMAWIISNYWDFINRTGLLVNLLQIVIDPDFRMGTGAGKCLIILVQKFYENTTEKPILLRLAKLIMNKPNDLKLFVESCYDHTSLLQDWALILDCMEITPQEMEENENLMSTLSAILREAASLTLLGTPTVIRKFSKTDRPINSDQHVKLAAQLYPRLKKFISFYVDKEEVLQNIFETLVLIRPTCLESEHHKQALSVIQIFGKLFNRWSEQKVLLAFLDFLLYVDANVTESSEVCKIAIVDLKSDIAVQLHRESKDGKVEEALPVAIKTAAIYQRLDLNHNIMWEKLLTFLTVVKTNEEFVESASLACQWSLVWSLKSLDSYDNLSPTTQKVQELCLKTEQLMAQFFEMMKSDQKSWRLKVFTRMCEACIHWCKEINEITKDERVAEKLRPTNKVYQQLVPEITRVFEELIEPVDADTVAQYYRLVKMLFEMAVFRIVPVETLSITIKYYDKYYDNYRDLMETIMVSLKNKSENYLAVLIAQSVIMAYTDVATRHGVVDARSAEAKAILGLIQRFVAFKSVVTQAVITRTLHLILIYVANNKLANLLLYLGPFAGQTLEKQSMVSFISKHMEDSDNQSIIYFRNKLTKKLPVKRVSNSKKTQHN